MGNAMLKKLTQQIIILIMTASVGLCANVGEDWTSSDKDFSTTGSVTVGGNLSVGGNATITGDITKSGTISYSHGTPNSVDTTVEAKLGQILSVSDFSSFENAITDIGSVDTTLRVCSTITLPDGTAGTVPSNITLDFTCGGDITGTVGTLDETLTIEGKIISDENRQIFGFPVAVYLTGMNIVQAEWFGNLNRAVTSVVPNTSATVTVSSPIEISSDYTVPSNVDLKIVRPGVISGAYTLTINGGLNAGLYQIFDSTITITGSPKIDAVYPEWFKENVIPGTTDMATALQAAINLAVGSSHKVRLIGELYATSAELSITGPEKLSIEGQAFAQVDNVTKIIYTGIADSAASVLRCNVISGSPYLIDLNNIFLDANDLAGFSLYMEGLSGIRSGAGTLNNVAFRGYSVAGWVIGDSTTVANAAQFQLLKASNIYIHGGATNAGATGIHLNAQNLEWLTIRGLYIDPQNADSRHHKYHIYEVTGGLDIQGMLTTRSGTTTLVDGYALYLGGQFRISGWRAEDNYLLYTVPSAGNRSSSVSDLMQRPVSGINGADAVISLNYTGDPISVENVNIQGSIAIGGTNARNVTAIGVVFDNENADATSGGFIFTGPQNQRGMYHSQTGELMLRGDTPKMYGTLSDGTQKWLLDSDGGLVAGSVTVGTGNISNGYTSRKVLYDSTATDVLTYTLQDDASVGFQVDYMVYMSGSANTLVEHGTAYIAFVSDNGGVITASVPAKSTYAQALDGFTSLSVSFGTSVDATTDTVKVTITQTNDLALGLYCTFNVRLMQSLLGSPVNDRALLTW